MYAQTSASMCGSVFSLCSGAGQKGHFERSRQEIRWVMGRSWKMFLMTHKLHSLIFCRKTTGCRPAQLCCLRRSDWKWLSVKDLSGNGKRQQVSQWEKDECLLSLFVLPPSLSSNGSNLCLICKTLAGNSKVIIQWNQTSIQGNQCVYFNTLLTWSMCMSCVCALICIGSFGSILPSSEYDDTGLAFHEAFKDSRAFGFPTCFLWQPPGTFFELTKTLWPSELLSRSILTRRRWLADLRNVQKTANYLFILSHQRVSPQPCVQQWPCSFTWNFVPPQTHHPFFF